ncbi:MAG: transglutaminase N-terminal domain-containing protein [Burkholderiales bacterium]
MRLDVVHTTQYAYDSPVRASTQYLRLTPRDSARQSVVSWRLEAPGTPTQVTDGYGNVLHVLTLDRPVREIRIRVSGTVDTRSVYDEGADPVPLSPLVFTRPTALTRAESELAVFAERFRRAAGSPSGLGELAAAILKKMPFTRGGTHAGNSAAEAFALSSGVCQDHTHVFLACCRHLGVPARYVSGYLYSEGAPEVASHAWAEAWTLDRWRSFDIANSRPAGEQHIKLAVGADYLDACPIRGTRVGGGGEKMVAVASVAQSQQ